MTPEMQEVADLLRRALRAFIIAAIALYLLSQAAALLGGMTPHSAAAAGRSVAPSNTMPS